MGRSRYEIDARRPGVRRATVGDEVVYFCASAKRARELRRGKDPDGRPRLALAPSERAALDMAWDRLGPAGAGQVLADLRACREILGRDCELVGHAPPAVDQVVDPDRPWWEVDD